MNFSEHFLALVRPNVAHVSGLSIFKDRRGYRVTVHRAGPTVHKETEYEAWLAVNSFAPHALPELANSDGLVYRALAARAELFLSGGPTALDHMEAQLFAQVCLIHETVIEALGAGRLTRAKVVPRRSKPSLNVTRLYVESKLALPYDSRENVMTVDVLPSPLTPSDWEMCVRMGAPSNDVLVESIKRMALARQLLADKGLNICDVVSGTSLLSLI